ncbi:MULTISPECIES: hypothetical protein [unclassified Nocardioides]|uniref:hypothetical protein n=1 Tax=unclassified Nocardioides TaxID=2615069 RepID=UPI0009F13706|nr:MULTISPECIES: hypothetical protein [unclassified Nocardioides]GAW49837.1 uncharacterized protein (Precursor) [Nocardioides sp. PD653-B2]
MRQLLGTTLLAMTLLAGCGDDRAAEVSPPAEVDPVTLVSGTAGRGAEATHATDVSEDAALATYVEQFDDPFAAKVSAAAGRIDVGSGQVLLAQVVAIGCDAPTSAHVRGHVIVPAKVASPLQECFAPVTTVALAVVPD